VEVVDASDFGVLTSRTRWNKICFKSTIQAICWRLPDRFSHFHHCGHFHRENCVKVCNVIKWSKVKVIACEHRHTELGMANQTI